MIFNGVECFAYLITISNFRWRFAGLRSTPRMRNTARSVEMYNWMLCVCVCVECKLNCKRCSNILRCVEFSTPNEIIFIQRVCNEDVVVATTPLRYHLPNTKSDENLARPINVMQKSNANCVCVWKRWGVRETKRSQQLQTPNPSGKIPSSNIVSMMNSKQLKRKTRVLVACSHSFAPFLFVLPTIRLKYEHSHSHTSTKNGNEITRNSVKNVAYIFV